MSERPPISFVAVRDRASGRFLALGATWTMDDAEALRFDERGAAEIIRRFVCEPHAVDAVLLEDRARAVA